MPRNKWTNADVPSMAGRTVVITGASHGLGALTARELAGAGATVVLAVRDLNKGRRVAGAIPGATEVRALDLASLESVRAFAEAWTDEIDILIDNAGIMQVPQGRTADGFELQMGTNYLGPFALTRLLLPHITDRVVVVTSDLYRSGEIHLDDLNGERRSYNPLQAYKDSKLASMLFVLELQRQLTATDSQVRAVAAHPGSAPTGLISHIGGFAGFMQKRISGLLGNDVEHAVLPILYAATQDVPGAAYVGPDGFARLRGYPEIQEPTRTAKDAELAKRLWAISVDLTDSSPPPNAEKLRRIA
jgi:NAD(P)-dependent dehydrogenase (short-subunit alcohol dehydrogenase family)